MFENHNDVYDEDLDTSNHVLAKNSSVVNGNHAHMKISDNRRPIYGVLTEPLRGTIKNKRDSSESLSSEEDDVSYIPKAHVQFLEQSGIAVVPIHFTKSHDDIVSELENVNGIYIPGDSGKSISNVKYQHAFKAVMDFVESSKDK